MEQEKQKKQFSKKHFYAYQYENESEEMSTSDYYEEIYTQPSTTRQARKHSKQGKRRYLIDFY